MNATAKRFLFGTCFSILALTLYQGPAASAGNGYKNLKIFPKDVEKSALKAEMKSYAKALGIKCDGCHDVNAFDKDTKMKKEAREMMRLTKTLNKRLKKDGFKDTVSCNTCHQGKEHPTSK